MLENGPNEYTDEWRKDMEVWGFSLREDQKKNDVCMKQHWYSRIMNML